MKRALSAALTVLAVLTLLASAAAAPSKGSSLDMYTGVVERAEAAKLARRGVDIAAARAKGQRLEVDLVLTAREAERLRGQGVQLGLKKNRDGKTIKQLAEEQAAAGYTVWRSWDEPGGIHGISRKSAADMIVDAALAEMA